MNLVKWNPFRDMETFFENYPSAMSERRSEASKIFENWTPRVDISETPEEFLVKAELPAVDKKDINIEIDNGLLTLTGERHFEEDDNKKHHRVERFFGSFTRTFSLPETVSDENVKAEFNNGLLTVTLLKTEAPRSRAKKIEIH